MENPLDYKISELNALTAKKGRILIAEPFSKDSYFKRSVVLLVNHDEEGSLGFIMNKPLTIPFNELVTDFPDFKTQVYMGGPVSTDTLHFIHTKGELINNSIPITEGLWWGGDFNQMRMLVDLGKITPNNIQFYVGYSGWSAQQLQDEIDTDCWIITDASADIITHSDKNALWHNLLVRMGTQHSVIAGFPEDPSLN